MIESTIGMMTLTLTMLFQMTDFQDGIPTGEYEDLGYQCHMPDDYNWQHDMDEDFQDGIPISEYEKMFVNWCLMTMIAMWMKVLIAVND